MHFSLFKRQALALPASNYCTDTDGSEMSKTFSSNFNSAGCPYQMIHKAVLVILTTASLPVHRQSETLEVLCLCPSPSFHSLHLQLLPNVKWNSSDHRHLLFFSCIDFLCVLIVFDNLGKRWYGMHSCQTQCHIVLKTLERS